MFNRNDRNQRRHTLDKAASHPFPKTIGWEAFLWWFGSAFSAPTRQAKGNQFEESSYASADWTSNPWNGPTCLADLSGRPKGFPKNMLDK